jgi:hypothetical protein
MVRVFVSSKVVVTIVTIGILAMLPQTAQAIPADVVKPAVEDKVEFAFEPADLEKTTYEDGWINDRMQINIDKRLVTLDLDLILEPFKQRPGVQWWVGEHIGKFLHAASYSYQFTGDKRLRERMDYASLPNCPMGILVHMKNMTNSSREMAWIGVDRSGMSGCTNTTSSDCSPTTRLQVTSQP